MVKRTKSLEPSNRLHRMRKTDGALFRLALQRAMMALSPSPESGALQTWRGLVPLGLETGHSMNAELATFPDAISRKRVLSIEASAEFIGVSINTCRRMYNAGTLPKPIPLNARKLG